MANQLECRRLKHKYNLIPIKLKKIISVNYEIPMGPNLANASIKASSLGKTCANPGSVPNVVGCEHSSCYENYKKYY